MEEKNQILLKLVLTHILLLLGLVFLSLISQKDSFLLISITQSTLLIILFAGYWEFFSIKFKWIYCLSIEILIFISLLYRLISGKTEFSTAFWLSTLVVIQLYLLWLLGKIITVIFKYDKDYVEIEFPFERGLYLITDGGNSKISRMMNYHYHSFSPHSLTHSHLPSCRDF